MCIQRSCLVVVGLAWLSASQVCGQGTPTFSIDFQGPTAGGAGPGAGVPDFFFGAAIDEGQILTTGMPGPLGPNPPTPAFPPPGVMVDSVAFSPLGSVPGGVGLAPAFAVELNALSYGRDTGRQVFFSVDEWAVGDVTGPLTPPDVVSEGAFGAAEASADVFRYLGPVPAAVPPFPVGGIGGIGPGNTLVTDGDGLIAPGFGLVEPNFPMPGGFDMGDNVDAIDMDTALADVGGAIYFSLEGGMFDPNEGVLKSATAAANGVSSAAVLISAAGALPAVFAPPLVLGLDLAGFGTDDLDAVALNDIGIPGVFQPGVDSIMYSVARGSAVIGTFDSAFGYPIEEGDVLTLPIAPGLPPAIAIPAEMLGLATVRSGTASPVTLLGDELNALDLATIVLGDFDGDGAFTCGDIDMLMTDIAFGIGSLLFDMTGDGLVDLSDRDAWLTVAGAANLASGNPYLLGDANLDGLVDGADFVVWNSGKFTATTGWCSADFNGDGFVDGVDFIIWNTNKFLAADLRAVPEPNLATLCCLVALAATRSSARRSWFT